jgi:NAD(P)H-hydrate repair Nnr-like enzyme with NAD(P)H-hydrate dehydratase domain
MDARLAAVAAATAHALAARTFGRPGLVASDVVEALPRVLSGAV